MSTESDLLSNFTKSQHIRAPIEKLWSEITTLFFPAGVGNFTSMGASYDVMGLGAQPLAAQRSMRVVDGTGMWALDRLAAGVESMVSPIGQQWQSLGVNDEFGTTVSDQEQGWLDDHAKYLFRVRYAPQSGFQLANHQAVKGACGLGSAFVFVEEWFGEKGVRLPFRYQCLPLSECYIMRDSWGLVNDFKREFVLTAFNSATRYGWENLPPKIKEAANHPTDRNKPFRFLFSIHERRESGPQRQSREIRHSRWQTMIMAIDEMKIVNHKGYHEFPIIDYSWQPSASSPYAECPTMLALADLKSIQVLSLDELSASRQLIKPPLGAPSQGLFRRLNLNSNKINYGAVNNRGELLVRPLITAQAPTFAQAILGARKEAVKETMFLNLFQSLMNDPTKTATDAILRDQERAQIIGPIGVSFEGSYSRMTERELAILERKGAYRENSPLAPPESLRGRNMVGTYTSPLNRMRRLSEFTSISRIAELTGALAKAFPEVVDNLDADAVIRLAQEILGGPRKMLKTRDKMMEDREARAQLKQMMEQAQATKAMGEAGNQAVPALQQTLDLGERMAPGIQQLMNMAGQQQAEPAGPPPTSPQAV